MNYAPSFRFFGPVSQMTLRRAFILTFIKAQGASMAATATDYGLIFVLTEVFQVWYVASTAIGAFAGAVVNFLLNRHWTFQTQSERLQGQAIRYTLVSAGSLALNAGGVYCLTEFFHIHYGIPVVLVSVLVGFFFNYPLHRNYVYRVERKEV